MNQNTPKQAQFWFVSRHQGAADWIKQQGVHIDHFVQHLPDNSSLHAGDVVIGSLPPAKINELNRNGIRFFQLDVDLQENERGNELNADDLILNNARLTEYTSQRFSSTNGCEVIKGLQQQQRQSAPATHCFIVVSTFQNAANLPLILEHASTNDELLLLFTQQVKVQTERLQEVLARHGYSNVHTLPVPDSYKMLREHLLNKLAQINARQLCFIGNGGPKPLSQAIEDSVRHLPHTTYYCEQQPYYQTYNGSIFEAAGPQYFAAEKLSLEDILRLQGFTMEGVKDKGVQIWPANAAPSVKSQYGIDKNVTGNAHSVNFIKNHIKEQKALPWYETKTLSPSFYQQWQAKVQSLLDFLIQAINEYQNFTITALPVSEAFDKYLFDAFSRVGLHKPEYAYFTLDEWMKKSKHQLDLLTKAIISQLSTQFHELGLEHLVQTVNSNRAELLKKLQSCDQLTQLLGSYQNELKKRRKKGYPEHKLTFSMGFAMEDIVTQRVYHFLKANEALAKKVLNSAWVGVRSMPSSPDARKLVTAEFDILLVTKHASLIHLECKAAASTVKDLSARLTTIQQASSSLAKMYVVAPHYTDFPDASWTAMHQRLAEQQRQTRGQDFIPFTLPDQPERFAEHDEAAVPTFELSLEKLLKSMLIN
ncbi:CRISPR-associated protein Csx16 [Alteromonas ponticola]|uniref:CRISPR-associated protein Csx16 n=1 Tax=Alteromonas aquimaris TaxID=2998417 RepID=A0ABT3PBW2_9ALTE|nr:CRISPR-associated protein Csx16 [Alteromonas aquimaris]MCW8109591.1 CRISPR-associated protein Csx16 [Alteromonas aquimaris]